MLRVDGEAVSFAAPKDASLRGISMVYQETSLVPQLTVAQNMVLGRERAFNSVRKVRNAARQVLQRLNFKVDPSQLAGSLSAAKRQMVEIARAVLNEARVIILDEPTAALTPEETDHLFDLMQSLKRAGVSMIFISHALEEALHHADRISVLRNGRMVVTGPASGFDRAQLIRHMIGEDLAEQGRPSATARSGASAGADAAGGKHPHGLDGQQHVVLDLSRRDHRHRRPDRIGPQRGGEGHHGPHQAQLRRRTDLARRQGGALRHPRAGGRRRHRLCQRGPQAGRVLRHAGGGPRTSASAGSPSSAAGKCFRRSAGCAQIALEWEKRLSIRRIGADQPVLQLSGGNQQKVVIAKSLVQQPRLVIFDEPTRGVDVGAIAEIRQIIRDIADSGAGVILISSYLPEILELSDRILVAKSGTIAAEFSRAEASAERILHAAVH